MSGLLAIAALAAIFAVFLIVQAMLLTTRSKKNLQATFGSVRSCGSDANPRIIRIEPARGQQEASATQPPDSDIAALTEETPHSADLAETPPEERNDP